MQQFHSKTVLITGGSDGIGFAMAAAFAKQGADLILVARDQAKLCQKEEQLRQYNRSILTVSEDMSRPGSVARLQKKIRQNKGRVHILVNNAAIARFIPFKDMDEKSLDLHWQLNVKAPYLLTRAFLEDLTDSQGCVLNISSYFARRMLPDRPSTVYSLTKGALESFTKALAYELGQSRVRVNAIAPGVVSTPQVKANFERLDQAARERFQAMIKTIYPLQTTGQPEDIANMAVFLASDEAGWITGSIFAVDGGLTTN